MQFLNYIGSCEKITPDYYKFDFKNGFESECKPVFIVPPIYDVSFKKVFYNKVNGLKILKDFLNSLIFPETQAIVELKFIHKEILSNSHLKKNKGTRIVDDACIAIIKCKGKRFNGQIQEEFLKEVIIDFEMESNYQEDKYTNKFFDYATGLRNQNDFKETWVIALGINKTNSYITDKGSKSYVTKKYNVYNVYKDLDCVKIFEIYLNYLFSKINEPISIFNNEKIGHCGKEWIKLFCIELWATGVSEQGYCLPSNLEFKGSCIKQAIDILADIFGEVGHKIKVDNFYKEEEKKRHLDEINASYQNGRKEGIKEGIKEGRMEGIKEGIKEGRMEGNLELLDNFFKRFKDKEVLQNIFLLEKVSSSLLIERYGNTQIVKKFIKKLFEQKWLIDSQINY